MLCGVLSAMSSFASDERGGGSLCTPEEKWEGAVNFNRDAINDKLRLQMQVIVAHLCAHEEIWGEWELRRLTEARGGCKPFLHC